MKLRRYEGNPILVPDDRPWRDVVTFNPGAIVEDRDYIFITFITRYLPIGLVGLLLAVIFSAAMSSTSSELNALATTTVIDLGKYLAAVIVYFVSDQFVARDTVISTCINIVAGGNIIAVRA